MSSVVVHIRSTGEDVEITQEDLATTDPQQIVDLLKEQRAPFRVWLSVALMYYRMQNVEAYEKVLELFDMTNPDSDRELNELYNTKHPESMSAEEKRYLVYILNSLAAHWMNKARKLSKNSDSRSAKEKEDLITKAVRLYNRGDNFDHMVPITWLGKGLAYLSRAQRDKAREQFQTVYDNVPSSQLAKVALAACAYSEHKYEEAIDLLAQVLLARYRMALDVTSDPKQIDLLTGTGVYAGIRPALAVLWHSLHQTNRAILGLKRQRDITPNNDFTLAAFATLLIGQYNQEVGQSMSAAAEGKIVPPPDPKRLAAVMNMVVKAYELNNQNAMALNLLANHLFLSKKHEERDYAKIRLLAMSASSCTTVKRTRAEAIYHTARVCHAQGDYNKAYQLYHDAIVLSPDFTLALFGMAQMHIHKKEHHKAVECLKKVLEKFPDTVEALKMLGALYIHLRKYDEAEQPLQRAVRLRPDDYECWADLALVLERKDVTEALHAYSEAIHQMQRQNVPVPQELWNNLGVLRQRCGDPHGARDAYLRAILCQADDSHGIPSEQRKEYLDIPYLKKIPEEQILSELKEEAFYIGPNVTVAYNLARLAEEQRQDKLAEQMYKKILLEYPGYVDAWLRLGCMAKARGQFLEAMESFKEALAVDHKHVGAWTMMANMQFERHEVQPAQKTYEKLLSWDRNDSYALCQLANIYLQAAENEKKTGNKAKRDKYLQTAVEFFSVVLRRDPANLYAANGLGICLAQYGRLTEAKEAFLDVYAAAIEQAQHMTGDKKNAFLDVSINLAILYLEEGNHNAAIEMFNKVLKRCSPSQTVSILPALTKAYFLAGRWEDAKNAALQAVRLSPWQLDLWFNYAVICKEQASRLRHSESTTSEQFRNIVIPGFRTAAHIFRWLHTVGAQPNVRRHFSTNRCERMAQMCEGNAESAESRMEEIRQREEQRQREIEQRRLQILAAAEERRKKELEEEERRALEQKMLEERAEAIRKRREELQEEWKSAALAAAVAEKSKKMKIAYDDDTIAPPPPKSKESSRGNSAAEDEGLDVPS